MESPAHNECDCDALLDLVHPEDRVEVARAFHEAVCELRIAMLGEIASYLTHEMTQPLAAIVANCEAALRWQRVTPANLKEIGLAGERVRRDALRANALLDRIRTSASRIAPERKNGYLNETARETLKMLISAIEHQ